MHTYLRKVISSYQICILAVTLFFQTAMSQNSNKPNILFVMSDQWRKQSLGFMDEDRYVLPVVHVC